MLPTDKKKTEIYKIAKIWGLLSFIPLVLAAAPVAGFFLGEYLESKIGFAPYISLFCVLMGFLAGAREVIRIIKLINKTDK